jgi:3'(2'), 5'-bisphosphate nucleotidase
MISILANAALQAGKKIMEVYETDFGFTEKLDNSPLTQADLAANSAINNFLGSMGIPILSEEGAEIDYEVRSEWSRYLLIDPLDGTKEFLKKNGEFTVNIALIEGKSPVFGVVYAPALGIMYVGSIFDGSYKLNIATDKVFFSRMLQNRNRIPFIKENRPLKMVTSRSHFNEKTETFYKRYKRVFGKPELEAIGSSLKMCRIAEGIADIYPRMGPTMEWDTAAAHAICKGAGKNLYTYPGHKELNYNKRDLTNPHFIAL